MAEEVEISRDELLKEAEDFLKEAETSDDPEGEYKKYKIPALTVFYDRNYQRAVLDIKVIGKMLSDFDSYTTELFVQRFYNEEALFQNRLVQHYANFKSTPEKYFYFEPEDKYQSPQYSFNVLLAHVLAQKKRIKLDEAVQHIRVFADPFIIGKYELKFDQKTIDDHKAYVDTLSVPDAASGNYEASGATAAMGKTVRDLRSPAVQAVLKAVSDSDDDETSESNSDLSKGSPSKVSDSSSLELDPDGSPLDDSQQPSPVPSNASSGLGGFPTFFPKASSLRLCVVSPAAGTADNPIIL